MSDAKNNASAEWARLTGTQRAALSRVAWGSKHFTMMFTGRSTRLRTVRQLAARGLVAPAGLGLVCDGDGWALLPERYRHGWKITAYGKAVLSWEVPRG